MLSFAPTSPPPTPEHLALITEALCARAAARNKAAVTSTQKRRLQFQQELAFLRNSVSSDNPVTNISTVTTSPKGAAAVIQARLTRIIPTQIPQPHHFESHDVAAEQSRIDAYHQRMSKYSHVPVVKETSKTVSKSGYVEPKPLDVDHVLTAAPVRPAIPSAKVVPMITAHDEEKDQPKQPVEEVQRPSLIDAVVRAFNNFVDRISDKKDDRDRDPDPVTVSTAAAQVLAVFLSLGKH